MKNEIKDKSAYEGTISKYYRSKEMLKTAILFFLILTGATLFTWFITVMALTEGLENPIYIPLIIYVWIIVGVFVIPYIVILILEYLYLSAYLNYFSYKIKENTIVIRHGVFTKTKATIPYTRIQNINIVNGVFDRMYKTFTVKIETAGSSATAASAQKGIAKPEGYIPGLKDPTIIGKKIKEMMTKYSQVPSGLEDKIFKPEELAFDNFISYVMSKMREGETLQTSIKERREQAKMSAAELAERVGVPIHTVMYLEEGRYNPSLALAYKIAQVLNCAIEDLFKMI